MLQLCAGLHIVCRCPSGCHRCGSLIKSKARPHHWGGALALKEVNEISERIFNASDTPEPFLAAAGVLAQYETDPGCHGFLTHRLDGCQRRSTAGSDLYRVTLDEGFPLGLRTFGVRLTVAKTSAN